MSTDELGDLPRMVSWNRADLVRTVESSLGRGRTITYAHCETVRRCLRDPSYLADIEAIDDCFIDGVGAQLAELLGRGRWLARTTSDDFVRDLWPLAAARGLRVALVGGLDGVAQRTASILGRHAAVEPVLVADGCLDDDGEDGLADRIAASRPDLVLLGMGQPLQERIAVAISHRVTGAVVICVGGLFDVLREGPSRPLWARRWGVEWMIRLAEEPTRVWRRYLLGPPETVGRIMRDKIRRSRRRPIRSRSSATRDYSANIT
jgi:N-acetylglucosaminyldiphosphoundecaprenol N-acetyl-beta-D-mannosaminyltransferase